MQSNDLHYNVGLFDKEQLWQCWGHVLYSGLKGAVAVQPQKENLSSVASSLYCRYANDSGWGQLAQLPCNYGKGGRGKETMVGTSRKLGATHKARQHILHTAIA